MLRDTADNPVRIDLPRDFRRRRLEFSSLAVLVGSFFTCLLLTLANEPTGWSFTAWFALVPWAVTIVAARRPGRAYLITYALAFLFFLWNLRFLIHITPAGYLALAFYLAWYFVLAGFILRKVYLHLRWPFTLVLPVVWVAQEYLRTIIGTGFPWLFLSHTQHDHLRLIQVSDTLGAFGVTFALALVNGFLCDLLLRPLNKSAAQKVRLGPLPLAVITVLTIVAVLWYGQFRLMEGETTIRKGENIAVIQEVIPQFVKDESANTEDIFNRHLKLTQEALAADPKPDLVVWPETMVTSPINLEFLNRNPIYFNDYGQEMQRQARAFDQQLRQTAKNAAPILVGTPSWELYDNAQFSYNSAVLFLADGDRFPGRYDKMHLVPFGEVVPFRKSWPWLYKTLMSFTPNDHEYTLDAGENPLAFSFRKDKGPKSRFAVAICYEDVTPEVPRALTLHDGQKQIDFILNISNDGWFVTGGKNGQPVRPTAELLQHLAICQFRAVENRVGIARAVNTGVSALIKPDGAVQHGKLAGTLPDDPRARQAVAGFLTDTIYHDSRLTFYTRHGDLFALLCTTLAALCLPAALFRKKSNSRKPVITYHSED